MPATQFFVLLAIAALGCAIGLCVHQLLSLLWEWLWKKGSILSRIAAGLSAAGVALALVVMVLDTFDQMTRVSDRIAEHDMRLESLTERVDGLLARQWHNVISQRVEDQCYLNDTGYPIELAVSTGVSTENERRDYGYYHMELVVDGSTIALSVNNNSAGGDKSCMATATIPPGAGYEIDADGILDGRVLPWWELRTDDTPASVC